MDSLTLNQVNQQMQVRALSEKEEAICEHDPETSVFCGPKCHGPEFWTDQTTYFSGNAGKFMGCSVCWYTLVNMEMSQLF